MGLSTGKNYNFIKSFTSSKGTYTGRKLSELINKPVAVARAYDAFARRDSNSIKADIAGLKVRSDSGHSSNYYSRKEIQKFFSSLILMIFFKLFKSLFYV